MRLLHPKTLEICSTKDSIPKYRITRLWCDVLTHVKGSVISDRFFFDTLYDFGLYMKIVKKYGDIKGITFDEDAILFDTAYPTEFVNGYTSSLNELDIDKYFDDNYLLIDAVILYYGGINIFEDLFPEDPEKYLPMKYLRDIIRRCNKTLGETYKLQQTPGKSIYDRQFYIVQKATCARRNKLKVNDTIRFGNKDLKCFYAFPRKKDAKYYLETLPDKEYRTIRRGQVDYLPEHKYMSKRKRRELMKKYGEG